MKHLLLLIAVVLLSSCGSDNSENRRGGTPYDEEDSTLLRVAVTPTLDCLPLYLASDHGLFDREGVQVVLRSYQAQMDQDTAIARSRVDIATTDLVRAERLQRQGVGLDYLSATNLYWQLHANKMARIKRLEQLDDKMLAMTRYSATALLSDVAVDSARLASERVFRIQVNDIGIRLNMLETGIMDALWLPEPQATRARQLGSTLLLDSRTLDIRLGVLAVRRSVASDSLRQQQVAAFVRAYNTACDSINIKGVGHYRTLIERYCGVKPEVTDSLPADTTFCAAQPPRQQDIERARRWLDRH